MGLKSKTENAKQKLAGLFFGHVNVFACESAMLELLKSGGNWASQREQGKGRRERRENPPLPPLLGEL